MKPQVSVIIPTFNRLGRLKRCIDKIRHNTAAPHAVIVVDGGSTDGTRAWLAEQRDLHVVLETQREGAVRAINKGFQSASTDYVIWLNDDSYPLPGAIDAALEFFVSVSTSSFFDGGNPVAGGDERAERARVHTVADVLSVDRHPPPLADLRFTGLGMVALYHNEHRTRNVLHEVRRSHSTYHINHVRGYPYANFGLLRRDVLERIGWLDERFRFCAFDPDLALSLQIDHGLAVIGCPEALVHHDEDHDERKLEDVPTGRNDNVRLFEKWKLPSAGKYADPKPVYDRMMRTISACAGAAKPRAGTCSTLTSGLARDKR